MSYLPVKILREHEKESNRRSCLYYEDCKATTRKLMWGCDTRFTDDLGVRCTEFSVFEAGITKTQAIKSHGENN